MTRVNHHRRRGAIIVPVLVCFMLIMLICAALVKLVLAERGVGRLEERRLQAEWLAEAGLERATAKLARTRDYKGETWDVAADRLGGHDAGRVVITVATAHDAPRSRAITVLADYPIAAERRARQRRSLAVELGAESRAGGAP